MITREEYELMYGILAKEMSSSLQEAKKPVDEKELKVMTKMAAKLEKFVDHEDKTVSKAAQAAVKALQAGNKKQAVKALEKLAGCEIKAPATAASKMVATLSESVESIEEISGTTLGSYIQKARAQDNEKRLHALELDADPKVQAAKDKISDYYWRGKYDNSGNSKYQKNIDTQRARIDARKKQLDPNYPDSTVPSRSGGIDKAIDKLKYGKLTDSVEEDADGMYDEFMSSGWKMVTNTKMNQIYRQSERQWAGPVNHTVANFMLLDEIGMPYEEGHDDYGPTRYFTNKGEVVAVYQRGWDKVADAPIISVRSIEHTDDAAVKELLELLRL